MIALNELVGWSGTIRELMQIEIQALIDQLSLFLTSSGFTVNDLHERSWRDTYNFFNEVFYEQTEQFKDLYIVMEYMLPLEKGRRPDVLLMLKKRIVVLEFKEKDKALLEDAEQVIGYREDLLKYHHITNLRNLNIEAYLVLTRASVQPKPISGIDILSKENFFEQLQLEIGESLSTKEVQEWVESAYQPLPSITKATLDLFSYGKLPHIKSIEEGSISATVQFIKNRIYKNETKENRKQIIFVSGVPGAGKTLVALKTLYDYNRYQFEKQNNPVASIYLSGNGPLVNVLQSQLEDVTFNGSSGKTYIRGVYAYKREYLNTKQVPPFHCVFFDEAQRAWDAERMKGPLSEPEGLLEIGEKIHERFGHVTIICFIGDGQAIHTGEEKGMPLWYEALQKYSTWQILVPPQYSSIFRGLAVHDFNQLYLDTSIRSSFIDTSKWIEAVLSPDIQLAKNELIKMKEKGYVLRMSSCITECIRFIESKLEEYPDIMYGMLVSSKVDDRIVQSITGVPTYKSYMKDTDAGRWFLHDSKTWKQGATEFVCQGLELDFPLICFGGDYVVKNGQWIIEDSVNRKNRRKYEDFATIVKNIYRVLLSRARKGMVLYIPEWQRETYEMLLRVGVDEI